MSTDQVINCLRHLTKLRPNANTTQSQIQSLHLYIHLHTTIAVKKEGKKEKKEKKKSAYLQPINTHSVKSRDQFLKGPLFDASYTFTGDLAPVKFTLSQNRTASVYFGTDTF